MNESSGSPRVRLLRLSLVFQLKLLADGLRDFLLVPVSLVATVAGLLRSGRDPEREFEQVLDLGRQTERWINLFGTHDAPDEAGAAGNLDQLVTRAERLVQEQVRRGDVSRSAGEALERALEGLHRRARQEEEETEEAKDDSGPPESRDRDQ